LIWILLIGIACADELHWLKGTWFYSEGALVTLEAGKIGEKWYYPNGQQIGNMRGDSIWYRPDGTFFRFAPELNEAQLVDVLWVLENIDRWLHLPEPDPTFDHLWDSGPTTKRF
jgi:hypothetical protein